MVIDTSALVAILFEEPEAARLEVAIRAAPAREDDAPTYVEAADRNASLLYKGADFAGTDILATRY